MLKFHMKKILHTTNNSSESCSLNVMILICSCKKLSSIILYQLVVFYSFIFIFRLEAKLHIYTIWVFCVIFCALV